MLSSERCSSVRSCATTPTLPARPAGSRARAPRRRCPSRRCRCRRRAPRSTLVARRKRSSARQRAGVAGRQVGRAQHAQLRKALLEHLREADAPLDLGRQARRLRARAAACRAPPAARPCAPSSRPAVRPAARLSAPTWVSRIEPATSENSVTTCTPERTSSLIASLTGGRSGAISATPSHSRQLRQLGGELLGVGGVEAVRDLGDVLVAEVTRRLRDLAIDQLEERRRVGRQHEGEAEVLAACAAGRAAAACRARPPPAARAAPSRR